MSENIENLYRERILEELGKLGVSGEKAEKIFPVMLNNALFLKGISLGSSYFNFKKKVIGSAELLGIATEKFVGAALVQPALFGQLPETINRNVEGSAELLGITKARFVSAALRSPPLFSQSPETINRNVEGSAELFALAKEKFVGTALKQPSLFYQLPKTINKKVEGSAKLLGISKAQFVGAALKQPQLFGQLPETINGNIEGSAKLLGIAKESFIGAALRKSPLFYQLPETINGNIEGSAKLLGITKARFVGVALKHPSLFYQLPETINGHARLMKEFNVQGIISPDVQNVYLSIPFLLSLSDDNFKLRLTFAQHAGITNQDGFKLLTKTRKLMEADMVALLGYDPDEKVIHGDVESKGYSLLQEMIADKRLKGYTLI